MLPPKLQRDVSLHDVLLLLHQNPGLLILSHLMFSEMLNVFRVDEILHPGIFVVELLKMVDFVFIFIISVVAGT